MVTLVAASSIMGADNNGLGGAVRLGVTSLSNGDGDFAEGDNPGNKGALQVEGGSKHLICVIWV